MLLVATTGLHPTRCVAPRMQQPGRQIAVRELQSQADLRVALEETPTMGISLLMLSAPDCAKAAKVKQTKQAKQTKRAKRAKRVMQTKQTEQAEKAVQAKQPRLANQTKQRKQARQTKQTRWKQ